MEDYTFSVELGKIVNEFKLEPVWVFEKYEKIKIVTNEVNRPGSNSRRNDRRDGGRPDRRDNRRGDRRDNNRGERRDNRGNNNFRGERKERTPREGGAK